MSPVVSATPPSAPATTKALSRIPITVTISAEGQEYEPSTITVPAGARVTLTFDNRDPGIPHNVIIFRDANLTTRLFSGKVVMGKNQITYTFNAPEQPGDYAIGCGIPSPHRTGTLRVE
jgi:plastocyanin